jgi:hypothetical protein
MLNRVRIRVHSWGGLGSQLFALATAFQLHQKFPKRKILLVVHSSGVTYRPLELDFQGDWLRIAFLDDFTDSAHFQKGISSVRRFNPRKVFKIFLSTSGFMNSMNTDSEVKRLKPWVTSVRGHYSHKKMDSDALRFLSQILDITLIGSKLNSAIGVHYRLGDLLTLDSKSFISERLLVEQLLFLRDRFKLSKIDVFTDSPSEARILLRQIDTNLDVLSRETVTTIQDLISYKVFLGTNSKISIWITLFRLTADPKSIVFLPSQSREEISRILVGFSSRENLHFFDCSEM